MKVISIGRRSSNEVVIQDPLVSREQHCLISEENGHYYIFDANSTNGTYVNGSRIPNAVKTPLHRTDVVRIGNTILPWQSYFAEKPTYEPISVPTDDTPDINRPTPAPTTTVLQTIALVLSIIGLGCIVLVAVKVMSFGIFGLAFNYTIGIIGGVSSLVALILAETAEYQEETDKTTMASAAEWISSSCLFIIIAFIIIINVNPDFLNPFAKMFK